MVNLVHTLVLSLAIIMIITINRTRWCIQIYCHNQVISQSRKTIILEIEMYKRMNRSHKRIIWYWENTNNNNILLKMTWEW